MSDPRARRETADPLQMSVAEKLACEWEARHDVAARGRIVHSAPVKQYLEHARCDDHRHPQRPASHRPHAPATEREPGPDGLRDWFRWVREGGSSGGSGLSGH